MTRGRIALVVALAALVVAFFAFGLDRYFTFEFFKSRQLEIESYTRAYPLRVAAAYFAVYILVTGLSLPGAAVMTLVGGALFGLLWGTVIVSFASSLGATLAFLASRFVLRDWVRQRFGARLGPIDAGVAREGGF